MGLRNWLRKFQITRELREAERLSHWRPKHPRRPIKEKMQIKDDMTVVLKSGGKTCVRH